ncbi:MAG: hypothetical protein KatS3mg023_3407 [Armatimonadota bacterium]|nr:MAG: hypothetical protein KatS3mg023_3407 [Armatimonadota bacterium]
MDDHGDTKMPLLGSIRVAGETEEGLTKKLTEMLKKYYVDPVVTVVILERFPRYVTVTGAVRKGGKVPLRENMSGAEQPDGGGRAVAGAVQSGHRTVDAIGYRQSRLVTEAKVRAKRTPPLPRKGRRCSSSSISRSSKRNLPPAGE